MILLLQNKQQPTRKNAHTMYCNVQKRTNEMFLDIIPVNIQNRATIGSTAKRYSDGMSLAGR